MKETGTFSGVSVSLLSVYLLLFLLPGTEEMQLLRRENRSVIIFEARKTDQGDLHFHQSSVFSHIFFSNAFSYLSVSVNNVGQPIVIG